MTLEPIVDESGYVIGVLAHGDQTAEAIRALIPGDPPGTPYDLQRWAPPECYEVRELGYVRWVPEPRESIFSKMLYPAEPGRGAFLATGLYLAGYGI